MTVREVCKSLTDAQCAAAERYLDLLEATNAHTNLTAIRDRDEMIQRHVADSLSALSLFSDRARVLDIGCGAGLPSLILKIARPDLKFTLVDSVRKKVNFVNTTIDSLGLDGVRAIHTRIEDLAEHDFDFVVARAVAALNILIEYSLPFLKVGGRLIAYKGERAQEELTAAEHALSLLGGQVENVVSCPLDGLNHNLIVVKKTRPTPSQYPRPRNLPRTKPL